MKTKTLNSSGQLVLATNRGSYYCSVFFEVFA